MGCRDAGSDHPAELAELDATLADLTDQLGTGVFTRGTPQRARLDARIAALAARQAELSAEAVKPAGWTWKGHRPEVRGLVGGSGRYRS
jgi:site-specific DNA recombinase